MLSRGARTAPPSAHLRAGRRAKMVAVGKKGRRSVPEFLKSAPLARCYGDSFPASGRRWGRPDAHPAAIATLAAIFPQCRTLFIFAITKYTRIFSDAQTPPPTPTRPGDVSELFKWILQYAKWIRKEQRSNDVGFSNYLYGNERY